MVILSHRVIMCHLRQVWKERSWAPVLRLFQASVSTTPRPSGALRTYHNNNQSINLTSIIMNWALAIFSAVRLNKMLLVFLRISSLNGKHWLGTGWFASERFAFGACGQNALGRLTSAQRTAQEEPVTPCRVDFSPNRSYLLQSWDHCPPQLCVTQWCYGTTFKRCTDIGLGWVLMSIFIDCWSLFDQTLIATPRQRRCSPWRHKGVWGVCVPVC